MKKFIIVAILINLILIISQIKLAIWMNNDGWDMWFMVLFLIDIIIYIFAVKLFINSHICSWDWIKRSQIIIVALSIIRILMINFEVYIPLDLLDILNYTCYINIILGIIGFIKTRDKIHLSFILWGFYTIIWMISLYPLEDMVMLK